MVVRLLYAPIQSCRSGHFASSTDACFSCAEKSKKNKATQIREIQAFQKFFQTAYDPLHLKRTVHYAAQTLRDRI